MLCFKPSRAGCASWPRQWGGKPCCISQKPSIHRQPIAWHLFDVTVTSQVAGLFHAGRIFRRFFGVPVRSLNLEEGQLTASNFVDVRDPSMLSAEQVRWGPTSPQDLPQPPFQITRAKDEGKTPGFFVKDARGRAYLFKLDPLEAPELLSGAEVVTSKLLYALGYHVPSYEIVVVHRQDLLIGEEIATTLTQERLDQLLEARLQEGSFRVSASRLVDGEVLGPASFKRFRDCTEMRALKVAYAWVNNIDTKDHNSLLVWDGQQTIGYLIDFGTALGADAGQAGPKGPCAGWLNQVDLKEVSLKLITLGMHRPACDPSDQPISRSVGLFSNSVDPNRWKPYAPNLAFKEMNEEDARWIVKRLARFSFPQITAAVSSGQYSNAEDAAYLAKMLEQRRLSIVDYYLED
ncbi:MAG: hypothetical protein HYY57_02015 [Candidatus Omnitrophica bacterium]|nr:hypothetical protein [Candidatus Omnitrophota bacterium]